MIHIKYIKEAMLGDSITCSCYQESGRQEISITGCTNQNGKDVAEMNSQWIERLIRPGIQSILPCLTVSPSKDGETGRISRKESSDLITALSGS